MDEEKKYEIAKERIKDRIDFFHHLIFYLIFVVFFIIINNVTSPNTQWWYWPTIGWGIGVIVHFLCISTVFFNQEKIERMIENEMDKMK